MPIEEAARRASTVVVGTVVGTQVEPLPEGVRTAVRLWVDESLKGHAAGLTTVYVPGGKLADGSSMVVDSMASFAPGEACCVFVDDRGWVLGGYQGKVHLGESGFGNAAVSQSAAIARVKAVLGGEDVVAGAAPGADTRAQGSPTVSVTVGQPTIASVTPGSAPAGTHSKVTISGSGFGAIPGKVEFALNVYGVARLAANQITSWADTQIVCEVPTGRLAGSTVSAGSGPIVVTHQNGSQSNPYELGVPFGYAAQKWPTPQTQFLLNSRGVDAARRELLVDAAAASWTGARSAFQFTDAGPTNVGAAKDGRNVISWSDTIPEGVVAMTSGYMGASGVIQECDILFNNALTWGDGLTDGTTDVQSVTLHELGHWLGLLDQYAEADADKVMYGFNLPGQQRELTVADISGIRWIYPAPSGTLRGMVRSSADLPIVGATLLAETCVPVTSAQDGSFVISGTPAGSYQVVCSSAGYTTQVFSAEIVADQTAETTITLAPGKPLPVFRFYNKRNGSHFYTASVAERDEVVSRLSASFNLEGTAYTINTLDPVNGAPLFRFYNKRNGSHFYTVSLAERDSVRDKLSATYNYEGPAYSVSPMPSPSAVPVYRFYNKKNGTHFYTASTDEKNRVMRNLTSTYTYEGPAFWTSP